MEGAGQIDGNHSVPSLHRKVFYAGHVLNASVVDQDVDAAKFFFGKLHHGFNFGGLAHVGAVVGHLGTQGCDVCLGSCMVAKTV